jgi:hypothetical protein
MKGKKKKKKGKNERNTHKLLIKIITKKLCEMDELKMGPVNVFLPRSAHTSHHF